MQNESGKINGEPTYDPEHPYRFTYMKKGETCMKEDKQR
jgi:hypothetical protein